MLNYISRFVSEIITITEVLLCNISHYRGIDAPLDFFKQKLGSSTFPVALRPKAGDFLGRRPSRCRYICRFLLSSISTGFTRWSTGSIAPATALPRKKALQSQHLVHENIADRGLNWSPTCRPCRRRGRVHSAAFSWASSSVWTSHWTEPFEWFHHPRSNLQTGRTFGLISEQNHRIMFKSRLLPMLRFLPNMDDGQPNVDPAPAPDGIVVLKVSVKSGHVAKGST